MKGKRVFTSMTLFLIRREDNKLTNTRSNIIWICIEIKNCTITNRGIADLTSMRFFIQIKELPFFIIINKICCFNCKNSYCFNSLMKITKTRSSKSSLILLFFIYLFIFQIEFSFFF